jgi:hypothetical protein
MKLILNGLAFFLMCYFSLLAHNPVMLNVAEKTEHSTCCCSGINCMCDASVKSCCSNATGLKSILASECGVIESEQVFSVSLMKQYCFSELISFNLPKLNLFLRDDVTCDLFLLSKKIEKPPQFLLV